MGDAAPSFLQLGLSRLLRVREEQNLSGSPRRVQPALPKLEGAGAQSQDCHSENKTGHGQISLQSLCMYTVVGR